MGLGDEYPVRSGAGTSIWTSASFQECPTFFPALPNVPESVSFGCWLRIQQTGINTPVCNAMGAHQVAVVEDWLLLHIAEN